MFVSDVLSDIMDERERQEEKWGTVRHDDCYWLALLVEEVGEMARVIVGGGRPVLATELYLEMIQVAALIIAWAEQMPSIPKPHPAAGDEIDRGQWSRTLRSLIRKSSNKAFEDGLVDGGIEDPKLSDDEE